MEKKMIGTWFNEGAVSIPNLLLQHYKQLDLNELECMILIQMQSFITQGTQFPTPDQLAERMTFSSEKCMELITTLIQKGFLHIEEHYDEVKMLYFESYSLKPLWEKLAIFIHNKTHTEKGRKKEESLYTLFEQEFGRPLSPIECETLGMWIDDDNHSADLIIAALKESVLSGKLNFRYIDRILFEWKKNGISTVAEAHTYSERFRQRSQRARQDKETNQKTNYPFYNWL